MPDNKDIIKAAKILMGEKIDLGEDVKRIKESLDRLKDDNIEETANCILDHLTRHPKALEGLLEKVRMDQESFGPVTKGISSPPGNPAPISAGTRMVCPEPGCGEKRTLRQKGQSFSCPKHQLPMVPENRLS